MSRGKYIVGTLKSAPFPVEGAVVFPESCDHAQVARQTLEEGSVLSAGFVTLFYDHDTHEIQVELYGESRSLKIAADPAHAGMVRRALGL